MQPVKLIQVKPQKRKKFTKKTKDAVLRDQNNICRMCSQYLKVAKFDHINDDRSDNSMFNCQALCPTCYDNKTAKETKAGVGKNKKNDPVLHFNKITKYSKTPILSSNQ